MIENKDQNKSQICSCGVEIPMVDECPKCGKISLRHTCRSGDILINERFSTEEKIKQNGVKGYKMRIDDIALKKHKEGIIYLGCEACGFICKIKL